MSTTKDKHNATSFERWEKDNILVKGLVADFEALLEDDSSMDLEFLVDQERVPAHRLVVVVRCERYRKKKRLNQPLSADRSPVTIQLGKHFSAVAVRDVVRYLYTGKVSRHNEAPFSLLQVCAEFGLPLLQSYLTRHVISHLTLDTVCQTLVGASSLMKSSRDESLKLALKQIAQESNAYVISHAREIFKGRGYLDLPKETFIGIIASNELSIQEEEVWHAVVGWGQRRSGVKQTMLLWTQDERALLQEALQGVLEHIRLTELSNDFIAREVEPAGLLPMEMMLDHYRRAAMNGTGGQGGVAGDGSDITSPRGGVQEPLADSAILQGRIDLQTQILKWISSIASPCHSPQEWACPVGGWVLLFQGSRDGFTANKFHTACDDKGSTIVVAKTAGGLVFGGYSDVSWSSRFKRGKFASSQNSFLFSLIGPQDTPPAKFPIQQPAYAINNHPGNGPIFGSGADLFISSNCNTNKDSYSQLGRSYGDSALSPHHLTGEQYFTIEDYEVFGLDNH